MNNDDDDASLIHFHSHVTDLGTADSLLKQAAYSS